MPRPRPLDPLRALVLGAALTASVPPASAQSAEDLFHRAYYLEHEEGDLAGALALYREVATKGSVELRARAGRAAAALAEDLAASDFARLLPGDALAYVELSRPGERVEALLGQLGLLLGERRDGAGADACARRAGVSPLLVRSLLGLRGLGVAVTAIDPNGGPPNGVAVLHPGRLDLLRGLVETALPNGAEPAEPIGGFETWRVEGELWVTLTERLVVASPERGQVAAVLERLAGRRDDSFAAQADLRPALDLRADDLLFFCVNARPLLPLLHEVVEREAQRDPGAAMAAAFCDLDSLRGLTGRLGVGADGLQLDVALDLAQGHRNLAFDLLRKPTLERRSLELVPDGAAFFAATTLNEPALPGARGSGAEEPIVTAMDFGREVFANVVDVALFGLPGEGGAGLPDVAAVVRVNDPRRSRALWQFVLGVAAQASGGSSMQPERVQVGGAEAERYSIGGVPVHLVVGEDCVTLSPSAGALARALGARSSGRSVLDDAAYASVLEGLRPDSTLAVCGQVGRLAELAEPHLPEQDRAELAAYASLLRDTSLSLALEHSSTRLALHARLCGLPDLSGLAAQLAQGRAGPHAGDPAATRAVRAVPERKASEKSGAHALAEARSAFEAIAHDPERSEQARALGREVSRAAGDDPAYLNDFAWALLTEERYRGAFDDLALSASKRSNELTGHSQWHLVDTLALAYFRAGDVERAIELEEHALELVGDGPRRAEVESALERFRDARDNTGPILVGR